MTCRLTISLLGPFQARLDGQPIVFRSDTMRALLAYLALEAGVQHHRESLAALLWPDHEPATALTNLRQTLSRLARAIGNKSVCPGLLHIDARTVRFDPDNDCQLDVRIFEEKVAQAQTHRHRRVAVCVSCVQALRQAAALYRGEFLSGLSLDGAPEFEQWALVQREHLHTLALSALSSLAAHHAQRGEWDVAYQDALRQIELEPWHEPAHRQMMQALAASGRRGAALAQYASCRRILLENLDVEPEDATRTLYAEIQTAESGAQISVQAGLVLHDSPSGNLPARTTSFVGRETELDRINEWLAGPDDRLITLTGLGGSGKTRLALQVAYEQRFFFRNGLCWVSLAGLTDLADILLAVAHALDLSLRGPASVFERLTAHLRDRELLLVLDNCEHLAALGQRIGALLRAAPQLYVLVTSRQPLRIHAERVLVVGGLSSTRAVELFAASVQQIDPGFDLDAHSPGNRAAVERICALVQGHPLALILAAVWMRTLSCAEVADEIAADVDILGTALHDLPERHQSLRALFEYTWQRMETRERAALSQMSVFCGRFTRQAAQAVCDVSLSMLQALAERSLLQQSGGGQYALHPLVTRFAAEKLDAMSALVVHLTQERHGVYYLTHLAEQGSIFQSQPQVALAQIGQRWPDILAAWRWAAAQARVGLLAASTKGLTAYLMYQGLFQQGEAILGAAARTLASQSLASRSSMDSAIRQVYGRLLGEHARFLNALAAYAQAAQTAQQAVAVAAATADVLGEARGHLARGIALSRLEDHAVAHQDLLRALHFFRQAGSRFGESQALNFVGTIANQLDDPAGAQGYHEQALQICREIGDRHGESIVLNSLAGSLYNQGRYVQARASWQQAREICSQIGNRWDENKAIGNLGTVAINLGHYDEAQTCLRQALDFSVHSADRHGQGIRLHELGIVASRLGDYERAFDCHQQAAQILHEIGELRWQTRARIGLGMVMGELGQIVQAETHCQQALATAADAGMAVERALALTALGHVFMASGRLAQAGDAYQEAATCGQAHGVVADPLAGLASIALAQGDEARALSHIESVLAQIEDNDATGVGHVVRGAADPFRVYLACYRVLQAANDPRAGHILQSAHALLQEYAARIDDKETRHSFLHNVAVHREIVEVWQISLCFSQSFK